MLLKTMSMKSINNKIALTFFLLLFSSFLTSAQEIFKDSAVDSIKTTQTNKRQKIDGVIATVGDYIILDSDIDKSFLEISGQGNSVKDITI